MTAPVAPLAELTATAIRLLCQEMGVVNTARFLNQFSLGYGDYTRERDQLLDEMTVDEIVTAIKRTQAS